MWRAEQGEGGVNALKGTYVCTQELVSSVLHHFLPELGLAHQGWLHSMQLALLPARLVKCLAVGCDAAGQTELLANSFL